MQIVRSSRRPGGRSLIVLAAAALAAACVGGCSKGPAQAQAGGGMPPPMVNVTPAVARDVPVYLDEIGKTVATQSVAIQPQVTGPITKINFVDGQTVHRGDVLFLIDPAPYQAVLDHSKATLDLDQRKLDFAQTDYKMVQDLQNQPGAMSKEDYEQKKNALDVAAAQIKIDQADVATAQVNLDYCTLRSPIDGRVGQRQFDLGSVVVGNNGFAASPMTTVETVDPIYVEFNIPENSLASVREAMKAGPLDAIASLPDHPDHPGHGKLTYLDNAVADATGDVKLRATLDNPDQYFWPGQFVNVRLILRMDKDAVLIPTMAQQINQTGPFVYIIGDGKAIMRQITLGQRQGDMIVATSGVAAGESVVVKGQLMLMPDAPVTVVPAAAPATGPSASAK